MAMLGHLNDYFDYPHLMHENTKLIIHCQHTQDFYSTENYIILYFR